MTLLGVFSPARGPAMPGGPGAEVLVFRPADVGEMKLTLGYVRPWERGVKPAKTQTFTVRVRE
jgi:predicted secreted protein